MAPKVYVRDYSLKGDWVVIGYPDGSVLLPKSELSGVDPFYRDEVLGLAMAVTERQRRRFLKAWSYETPRFDHRRHMVTYDVSVRMQTRPRTLATKALHGEFRVTLWWWTLPDGELQIEEQGRELVRAESSDHKVHLNTEDIPGELIDRMVEATRVYLES